MVPVKITCTKCFKEFTKNALNLAFVSQTWDAYSHCDDCEARIVKGGTNCSRCTDRRKEPYAGEAKPIFFALFDYNPKHFMLRVPRGAMWSLLDIRPKATVTIQKEPVNGV